MDQLHAVRAFRLADPIVSDIKKLRFGGQEDGRRVHHQRRRQRAVLSRNSANQGGRRRGHSGNRLLGRRRGTLGHRYHVRLVGHLAAWNYFHERRRGGQRMRSSSTRWLAIHRRRRSGDQRSRWKPTTSASRCGSEAVKKAGTTDVDRGPGRRMHRRRRGSQPLRGHGDGSLPNHHITKPVLHRRDPGDGQFDVVWQTDGTVPWRRVVRLSARLSEDIDR